MHILRTPEERFAHVPDFDFPGHVTEVDQLRIYAVDAGERSAAPVLLLHGEPTWSFLYRKMIPIITDAGYRAIAPDLVGFGRSDKPAEQADYTYQRHVEWMQQWLVANQLEHITLVCQDWGSLIGLRLAAALPERFERIVLSNGGLPTGDRPMGAAFQRWLDLSQTMPELPIGAIVRGGCVQPLDEAAQAAYDAPFPDERFKAGARVFPRLVPNHPDDPAAAANRAAWEVLRRWEKPFLTAFSDGDPITAGGDTLFQRLVPGAKGQPHTTITGGGHFVQEDRGPEFAQIVVNFIRQTEGASA